jgi:hypothetical protein
VALAVADFIIERFFSNGMLDRTIADHISVLWQGMALEAGMADKCPGSADSLHPAVPHRRRRGPADD